MKISSHSYLDGSIHGTWTVFSTRTWTTKKAESVPHSPNYVPAEVSITVIFKQGENMSTVTVLSMTHYHTSLEKDESLRYPASYAASSGCYRNNYSQAP